MTTIDVFVKAKTKGYLLNLTRIDISSLDELQQAEMKKAQYLEEGKRVFQEVPTAEQVYNQISRHYRYGKKRVHISYSVGRDTYLADYVESDLPEGSPLIGWDCAGILEWEAVGGRPAIKIPHDKIIRHNPMFLWYGNKAFASKLSDTEAYDHFIESLEQRRIEELIKIAVDDRHEQMEKELKDADNGVRMIELKKQLYTPELDIFDGKEAITIADLKGVISKWDCYGWDFSPYVLLDGQLLILALYENPNKYHQGYDRNLHEKPPVFGDWQSFRKGVYLLLAGTIRKD